MKTTLVPPAEPRRPNSGPEERGADAGEEMRFEDKLFLVSIGAQKAGSTWLSRYLAAHPDVFVPRMKELHYFDEVCPSANTLIVNRRLRSLVRPYAEAAIDEAGRLVDKKFQLLSELVERLEMTGPRRAPYMDLFRRRVGNERVFGDFTPAYSTLDAQGFAAILAQHPRVRFIFLMRDPVQRFWSGLRMNARKAKGFDPYSRFSEQLEDSGQAMSSDYARTIRELDQVARPDQLLFLFFEQLFTAESVRRITDFLEIAPVAGKFDTVVNPGEQMPLRPEHLAAACRRFAPVYDYVFARFGSEVPAVWHETFEAGRRIA